MQGTESRVSFPFTPLLVSVVQGPCRPLYAPAERDNDTFPPIAEESRLRQDVVSLEHWLDLNA
jgi:hypothetical protein